MEVLGGLSAEPNGLPESSYITQLNLKKVGETFTKPEIIISVTLSGDPGQPEPDTYIVDIPWAVKKG